MERYLAFQAVARSQSFSRAAERLHRTQPAVSQAVRALEQELGVTLFDRSRRAVQLTHAGSVLLPRVEEALAALEAGRVEVAALSGLQAGSLSVSVSDTLAIHVLPQLLGSFRKRFPSVELELSNRPSSGAVADVLSGQVELGFVTKPVRDRRLVTMLLCPLVDVLICAPDPPLAGRRRVAPSALGSEPLLVLDRSAELRRHLDRRLRAAGVRPRIAMELGSVEVIKRMVGLGLGVSVVPSLAVRKEVAAGDLCEVRISDATPPRQVAAVHRRRGGPSAAAQELLRLARATLPLGA